MRWPLIFALSLFGLAMAVATISEIPSTVEPVFWLAIFLVCAYGIARRAPGLVFLHGVALGIVNSVWVTGAHVLWFSTYIANHPREAAMTASMPLPTHPRVMMLIVGPIVGIVSGAIIGVFALVVSKFVRRGTPHVETAGRPAR